MEKDYLAFPIASHSSRCKLQDLGRIGGTRLHEAIEMNHCVYYLMYDGMLHITMFGILPLRVAQVHTVAASSYVKGPFYDEIQARFDRLNFIVSAMKRLYSSYRKLALGLTVREPDSDASLYRLGPFVLERIGRFLWLSIVRKWKWECLLIRRPIALWTRLSA